MRLRQLEYLVALERCGSYSGAAAELFVSQPAMSMAVKALEEELDCRLLRRCGRGVAFTRQGREILEQARAALEAVHKISQLAAGDGVDGLRCELRVGALPHLCGTLVGGACNLLTEENPNLHIELVWGESAALAAAVERGELDLAVVHGCELRDAPERRLQCGRLGEDVLRLVAVEGHPLAAAAGPVSREALCAYPFFAFQDYAAARDFGYTDAVRRFDDMVAMRRAMAAENGLALIPGRCIPHGNEMYTIRFVPIVTGQAEPTTEVLWLHAPGALRPAEQALIRRLERAFQAARPRESGD